MGTGSSFLLLATIYLYYNLARDWNAISVQPNKPQTAELLYNYTPISHCMYMYNSGSACAQLWSGNYGYCVI